MSEEEDLERPFDILNSMEGEEVIVTRTDGSEVVGTLQAFDKHINMALTDVEIHIPEEPNPIHNDRFFQRGSTVKDVQPESGIE